MKADTRKYLWIEEKTGIGPSEMTYGAWYFCEDVNDLVELLLEKIEKVVNDKIEIISSCNLSKNNFEEKLSIIKDVHSNIKFLIYRIQLDEFNIDKYINQIEKKLFKLEIEIKIIVCFGLENAIGLLEEHLGTSVKNTNKSLKELFENDILV